MRKAITLLAAVAFCAAAYSTAYALYGVSGTGTWPKTWPAELESLRNQARTLEGPEAPNLHYAIRFSKREEFEAAWPHLLKVKSKGAPIILVRGPNFFLGDIAKAGVVIHSPPATQRGKAAAPEEPIDGVTDAGDALMNTTYIELVVDGDVVDLNRIPLPADTPIMDQRFKDAANK